MARPVVLLSYFELDDLPRLLSAVEPAAFPAGVPIYVGSYGISPVASNLVRSVRRCAATRQCSRSSRACSG